MFPLLDLHDELVEEILGHCQRSDLKNVSICNKHLNQLAKNFIWDRLLICWKSLLDMEWTVPLIENLKFAKSLTFEDAAASTFPSVPTFNFDSPDDQFFDILKDDWTSEKAADLLEMYNRLLSYCNADIVEEFKSDRGGRVVHHACSVFPKLRKMDLFGVGDIGPPIDSLDGTCEGRDAQGYLDPFAAMRGLIDLREIVLCRNILEDEDSINLFRPGAFLQLTVLDLADCNSGIFACPVNLPNLRELNLDSTRCGDRALGMIRTTDSLRNINLHDTGVTDKGILKLCSKFKNLQMLSLYLCRITDKGIKSLCALKELEYLNLGFTAITDQALDHLSKVENLRGLSLSQCQQLTQESVSLVMELVSLKYLEISSKKAFSGEAIDWLRSSHSTLQKIKGGRMDTDFNSEDILARMNNVCEGFKLKKRNVSDGRWKMKAIQELIH